MFSIISKNPSSEKKLFDDLGLISVFPSDLLRKFDLETIMSFIYFLFGCAARFRRTTWRALSTGQGGPL